MNVDRSLKATEGYLQLEMPEDAMAELQRLPEAVRQKGHAMDLELAAEMMRKNWKQASVVAEELCVRNPTKRSYFLHAAYCMHECGETAAAKKMLLGGPKALKKDPLYHYNMACYAAVLGVKGEILGHLEKAFELDDSLRETAKNDGDLKYVDWSWL